ncbi:MAG TPA: hypothetical protein VHU87_14990 [Rhizomicrobium sp.]|nr:hypothetical protein [Rhizomicrobium sp.]
MNSAAGFRWRRRSSAPARTEPGAQHGWALVSVLWIVAILSMLAAAGQALTLTSTKTEHRAQDFARANSDLDAAVARAAIAIGDSDPTKRWRIDGVPQAFVFDGLKITVAVQDQLGLIDINSADVSTLTRLLQSEGLAPAAADALADKIIDWRSTADLHRLHGATDADYAAAHLPWRERHGAFQTVEELNLVMGMTPQLFARIRPALTVYSHRPGFDASTAPREALMELYLDDPQQVDAAIAQRNGPGLNPNPQLSVPPGILSPSVQPAGRAFAVDASLVLKGRTFTRHAVIEMTSDDRAPYFTLAWK